MAKLSIGGAVSNANMSAGVITLEEASVDHNMTVGDSKTNIGLSASGNICYSTASFDHYANVKGTKTGLQLDASGKVVLSTGTATAYGVTITDQVSNITKRSGGLQLGLGSPSALFGDPTNAFGIDLNGVSYVLDASDILTDNDLTPVNMDESNILHNYSPDGDALIFNGSNEYLDLNQHSGFDFGTGTDFSICLYASYSTTGGFASVVSSGDTTDKTTWSIRFNNNPRFIFRTNATNILPADAVQQFTPGVMHSFVVTVDRNGLAKGYIDGAFTTAAAMPTGTDFSSANNNINIGGRNDGASLYPGIIDGVRVYKRILTQTEITNLANRLK